METPSFTGRAVAALAADPGIMKKTGKVRKRFSFQFFFFSVLLFKVYFFFRSVSFNFLVVCLLVSVCLLSYFYVRFCLSVMSVTHDIY